jgi:hypothetical protein
MKGESCGEKLGRDSLVGSGISYVFESISISST